MSKGSGDRVRDKKQFDANFDGIDWGDTTPKPPGPQWKDKDFQYGDDWMDSESLISWNVPPEGRNAPD